MENSEAIEIQSMRNGWPWWPRSRGTQAGGTFAEFKARWATHDVILDDLVHPVAIQVQGSSATEHVRGTDHRDPRGEASWGLSIKYTLDNSLPNEKWEVYSGPITLEQTAYFRAGLFDEQARSMAT